MAAGDIDGDGLADVILGAGNHNNEKGEVYIVLAALRE